MKALILAAGYGSRLTRVNDDRPKALVDIGGRPILDRQVELLQSAAVDRICIVTGYGFDLIEQRYRQDVDYRFNPFFRQANNMVSFMFARDWIDDELIVLYADLLYAPSILAAALSSTADIGFLVDRSAIEPGHALVRIENGVVRQVDNALSRDEADARFIGVAKFSRQGLEDFLPELESAAKAGKTDQYYTVGVKSLIERGYPVSAVDITGQAWLEIDTPVDLERARREWA